MKRLNINKKGNRQPKRSLLLALCFIVHTCACFAQDIIVTKDSKRIEAKVAEVNADNVRFKRFDNPDGPLYTLLKSDIITIIYQNGRVEVFDTESSKSSTSASVPASSSAPASVPVQAAQNNSGAAKRPANVPTGKEQIKRQKKEIAYFNKVMKSNDYKTREKYTGLIGNEELLYRIVVEHRDIQTAMNALNRIKNKDILRKVAMESGSISAIEWAAERVGDEDLYFKIVQRNIKNVNQKPFRQMIVKITKQDLLYQLLADIQNDQIRMEIIERISDPEILKKVVDSSTRTNERLSALKKIDHQPYLYQLALTDKDRRVSNAALDRLNEEMLQKMVIDSNNDGLKMAAIRKIKDQQFLMEVISASTNERLRLAAFDGITDQQYLYALLNDKLFTTRALAKITDQDLLLKIVQETKDWDMRKSVFNKLNNSSLEIIAAGGSKDKALEVAAKIILKKTNWDAEFSSKSSEQLGRVIGAAALVDNPKPTSASVVNACHTYIRRGDKSRIPELRDLLLRYGDKSLAEDYLNCGNSQLEDAGREWGRKNGYSVGSGYGSHRVQWGSGR